MDAREYAELAAYERMYGELGPGRMDRLAAIVGWLASGNAKLKFADVMEFISGREKEALSIEQQMAIVRGAAPKGE